MLEIYKWYFGLIHAPIIIQLCVEEYTVTPDNVYSPNKHENQNS